MNASQNSTPRTRLKSRPPLRRLTMKSSIEDKPMEHTIFLDIETIPAQSAEAFEKYKAAVKAPGNIKKPESIEAWLAENRETAAREAIAKTSFDPAAGHICTIGWAVDDDEAVAAHATDVTQEREVIEAFFGALVNFHHYTFVGHNVASFDLRFIVCRAI